MELFLSRHAEMFDLAPYSVRVSCAHDNVSNLRIMLFDYRPLNFESAGEFRTNVCKQNAINSIENQWMELVWICGIHAVYAQLYVPSNRRCSHCSCDIHSIIAKIFLLAMILKMFPLANNNHNSNSNKNQQKDETHTTSKADLVGGQPNVTIFH